MAIPEAQLETWSAIGSQTQSKNTYATVRLCLDSNDAPYHKRGKTTRIFLQGSYGNDTNVYRESDVDVVIQLIGSTFYYDVARLTLSEAANFHGTYTDDAPYGFHEFKADVLTHLTNRFGSDVSAGNKAICIQAGSGRRRSDVVVCVEFRRYKNFTYSTNPDDYVMGICFFTSDNTRVINFPKQHSVNATAKHQATDSWYKPMVRIYKNMRNRLVAEGALASGVAPSYYIEGLLYNAPNNLFGISYATSFVQIFNWIDLANRKAFVCANEQYPLLDGDRHVTWTSANCTLFLDALRKLWNEW
jgi:hypothetical protein